MQVQRPPIVTVLGHVDHGKTTLLDAIRKTNISSREAGGITQSIGASVIDYQGHPITFIDTPGHAAFSKMRARGAAVADIAILVVAADDGVMPQTKEAISYIREVKIPFIVALTKIDLPSANAEAAKASLEKEEIFLEGRGGDVPLVEVSAKKGQGIGDLLEIINLVAQVNEIKGSFDMPLSAMIIETAKDRRGLVVSVVVKNGTLKVSDEIDAQGVITKVRGLFDDKGKSVRSVGPGEPCLILGFSTLPQVGAEILLKGESKKTAQTTEKKNRKDQELGMIPVFIKAQNQGVLDAILGGLDKQIAVIGYGVGDVTEGDVFLAKAAEAEILVFAAKVSTSIKRLVETEGVKIKTFEIIYELFDYLIAKVKKAEVEILCKAEIIKVFGANEKEKIAGCKLIIGEIHKKDKLELTRADTKLGDIRIISLKKAKTEVEGVKKGEEFGVYFEPQFDFKVGDVILSVRK